MPSEHWMSSVCVLCFVIVACSCGADADVMLPLIEVEAEATSATTTRFEWEEERALPFAAIPFPSDLYLDDRGHPRLGQLATAQSDSEMYQAVRALLATRTGFCTTCNVTFGIDGGLDLSSLPARAASEASLSDAVLLMDVDERSPERGRLVPLRAQWDAERGWLSVRPARGHALLRSRHYAAVVTDRLRGEDGLPLTPAATFRQARDGEADEKLTAVIEPALDALEELGVARRRIVALASFKTDDPTRDLRAMREAIHAGEPAVLEVDTVFGPEELDELLGVPAVDGAGVDLPPAAGVEGTLSVPHEHVALAVAGRFRAARFPEGTGGEVGVIGRDDEGVPVVSGYDEVPFLLTIPRGVDLGKLGVIVAHHGFSASRTTGFALAETAARAGFAVLSFDAYQHGGRARTTTDRLHAMRGNVEGPDGFAETSQLDIIMRVFGFAGVPEELKMFPGYPMSAFLQFAADGISAVRVVTDGDLSNLQAADERLEGLRFDASRIAYLGNSLGAVVGTAVTVAEPNLGAVVLNVLPGSIAENLAESGEFRPMTERLFLPLVGVEDEFDEEERSLVFDPTFDLFRWVLEPADPLALAPYLVRSRLDGGAAPDVLIQLAAHDEVAVPAASQSVVAAAGIGGVGEFSFASVTPVSLPAPTAAVVFDPAMHGMFEVHDQSSRWERPLMPPYSERAERVWIHNPVEDVHEQIEEFLISFKETGHGQISP